MSKLQAPASLSWRAKRQAAAQAHKPEAYRTNASRRLTVLLVAYSTRFPFRCKFSSIRCGGNGIGGSSSLRRSPEASSPLPPSFTDERDPRRPRRPLAEARSPIFATTRWTVVLNAGEAPSAEQADALAQLCQTYAVSPLCLHSKTRRERRGRAGSHAGVLRAPARTELPGPRGPNKGKFRWFLLGALRHFLANQRERARSSSAVGESFTFLLMRLRRRTAISLN